MNAFLDLAEQQIVAPVKARRRAAQKRAVCKGAVDQERQLGTIWRKWNDERRAALLAGEHGDAARALIEFLDGMKLHDGARLVLLIGPWTKADVDIRHEVLTMIDSAIIALRERHGLLPFDDALPGEPTNVFLQIREALS
jgi:hypothetical protein